MNIKYDNKRGYDDIIELHCHKSDTRPHMSLYDRAAQFSPFSALTGYDEAVTETEILTDMKQELSEEVKAELDMKLSVLRKKINEQPEVKITYFVPDERKSGGKYVTEVTSIKKIDKVKRLIVLGNNLAVGIDDIADISIENKNQF